jgi:hypothetical protein
MNQSLCFPTSQRSTFFGFDSFDLFMVDAVRTDCDRALYSTLPISFRDFFDFPSKSPRQGQLQEARRISARNTERTLKERQRRLEELRQKQSESWNRFC